MSLDWEGMQNMTYKCLRCGAEVKGETLIFINQLKCPNCGCKILMKQRAPKVKKLKAI
ncbi:MAG: DNA-directed RNA polymerase subunit P [Candidatus Bathyarchaeia archaeon]